MTKRLLTLDFLERLFKSAKEKGVKFVGLKIQMEGFPEPEIIINPTANFDKKLEYYKRAYNQDLTLKANAGIKIVDFSFGNTFDVLETDLLHI